MRVPEHYVHIYDKPTQGTGFQARYRVFNYKHKLAAMGNCITASCDIDVNRSQAEYVYNTFIGNRVAFYVDNPGEPIWEGIVSRITFSNGGIKRTASIDSMANRVRASNNNSTSITAARTLNTAAANLTSQSIYGIKEEVLDAPLQVNSTLRDSLVSMYVADKAWPASSTVPDTSNAFSLSIECIGISQTLEWELCSVTGSGIDSVVINASVEVANQITNLQNGTNFFDNTVTSGIATNTSFNVRKRETTASTVLEWLQTITEAGDGTNRYVFGITKTTNGTRTFYYRQSNPNTKYTAYLRDGVQIRNVFGRILPPWTITPDGFIEIRDLALAFNGVGDDPREAFIQGIDYDQNTQKVTWVSDDDITIDGALSFTRAVRRFGLKANSRAYRSAV